MRRILLLITIAIAGGRVGLMAQNPSASGPSAAYVAPRAFESQVAYQKTQQPAMLIDLPYPPDVVEDAIKDYMGRYGWKGSGSRGFTVFRNVRLDERGSDQNDVHFRVDRRNRDKNAAVVSMLVTKPGEDPATRVSRDTGSMFRGRIFLERMAPAITAYDLEVRIKGQTSTAKKSQGKLADLRDDQLDLEKKIRNTQSDLDQNKSDQAREAQALQANIQGTDPEATKKSQKKVNKLLDDQSSLQKKLQKYQAALVQNKKDQEVQQVGAQHEQQLLDSLRAMRRQ